MIAPVTGSRTVYAVCYARFSPRPNADECESCEHQLSEGLKWCEARGLSVACEFRDDALSGADVDRPGLALLMATVKRGHLVLVRDFDRLSRDTYHRLGLAMEITKRGARLVSMTEGEYKPHDKEYKLLFTILGGFGEYRRECIREATSKGMNRNQYKLGRRMGRRDRIPTGYMLDPLDDTKMIPCPTETEAVRLIRELHAAGESAQGIVDCLHGRGLEYRGGPWKRGTVRKILGRELSPA